MNTDQNSQITSHKKHPIFINNNQFTTLPPNHQNDLTQRYTTAFPNQQSGRYNRSPEDSMKSPQIERINEIVMRTQTRAMQQRFNKNLNINLNFNQRPQTENSIYFDTNQSSIRYNDMLKDNQQSTDISRNHNYVSQKDKHDYTSNQSFLHSYRRASIDSFKDKKNSNHFNENLHASKLQQVDEMQSQIQIRCQTRQSFKKEDQPFTRNQKQRKLYQSIDVTSNGFNKGLNFLNQDKIEDFHPGFSLQAKQIQRQKIQQIKEIQNFDINKSLINENIYLNDQLNKDEKNESKKIKDLKRKSLNDFKNNENSTLIKLFGKLQIRDVAFQGQKNIIDVPGSDQTDQHQIGIKGYNFNPELRFNFRNKKFLIPKLNPKTTKNYLDDIIKQKKNIPAPNMYMTHTDFLTPQIQKIYCHERRTSIDTVIAQSKGKVGVGKYEVYNYDEKRIKPPNGVTINKADDKYTYFDECMYVSKLVPSFYDQVPLEQTQRSIIKFKIRNETEKEIEQKKQQVNKNNSPSPTSYDFQRGYVITSQNDARFKNVSFTKDKKVSFLSKLVQKQQYLPGVGKYNPHLSIDKVYKPMKKY